MISIKRIYEFLSPLDTIGAKIPLAEGFAAINGLRDRIAVDVEAALAARSARKLGKIPNLEGREFPEAEDWNRFAVGGELTDGAKTILNAVAGHQVKSKLVQALLSCGDDEGIVDMAAFQARIEDTAAGIFKHLCHPSAFTGADIQIGLSTPMFKDAANLSPAGRPDRLLVDINGWDDLQLFVQRQGLGWQRADYVDYLKARGPVAEMPLERFIGRAHPIIVEDQNFGPAEQEMIDCTRDGLLRMRMDLDLYQEFRDGGPLIFADVREFQVPGYPDFRFFAQAPDLMMARLAILDAGTLKLAGGCVRGIPYVEEPWRGRGLGKAMHKADRQEALGLFMPSHFSRSGYEARRAFHRDEVVAAYEAGRKVHPDNLERYQDLLHLESAPQMGMS